MSLDKIAEILIQNGPMALVLGVAVYVLWRSNRETRTYYEGAPASGTSPAVKGKIELEAEAARAREDQIRASYEAELRKEREENKKLMREINDTLKHFLDK